MWLAVLAAGCPECGEREAVCTKGAGLPVVGADIEIDHWQCEQDAARADAWAAGVGDVRIETSVPKGRSAEGRVALVSWNIAVGEGDLEGFVVDLLAGRLTDGEPPSDFILLLQEAHRRDGSVPATLPADAEYADRLPDDVQVLAPLHEVVAGLAVTISRPLDLIYVPSMRNGQVGVGAAPEDRGNAIVSTLPLEDPLAIDLPIFQRRTAVSAVVAAGRSDERSDCLRATSVHFDVFTADVAMLSHRQRQASAVVQGLEQTGERRQLIGGDLNSVRGDLADFVERVAEFAPDGQCPDAPTHSGRVDTALDHMFSRGFDLACIVTPDTYGSDHLGIIDVVDADTVNCRVADVVPSG